MIIYILYLFHLSVFLFFLTIDIIIILTYYYITPVGIREQLVFMFYSCICMSHRTTTIFLSVTKLQIRVLHPVYCSTSTQLSLSHHAPVIVFRESSGISYGIIFYVCIIRISVYVPYLLDQS